MRNKMQIIMRKLILSIFIVSGFCLCSQTESPTPTVPTGVQLSTNTNVDAPSIVTNRFNTDYPNVSPVWAGTENGFVATYTERNSNLGRTVMYDRYGNVIRKDTELDNTSYPVPIKKYYAKTYPGEAYSIWMRESGQGSQNYFVIHQNDTSWFDNNGTYLRKPAKGRSTAKK
jgi:hypothetical protein